MPQTIIITGASRGLGLATAQLMLADGVHVVAVQRTRTPELSALQEKYPTALRVVQGDYTDEAVIVRALEGSDALDGLVLNAATNLPLGRVEQLPLEGWRRLFELDFFGAVRFVRAAIPLLRNSKLGGGARVVMVSSEAANAGATGGGPYSAAKAALNSLNRTLAAEESGITSIAFNPGAVRTEMVRDLECEGPKGHVPEALIKLIVDNQREPEVPGRALAKLALCAPRELSGQYLNWDDPKVAAL